jgi:hypothetical protein
MPPALCACHSDFSKVQTIIPPLAENPFLIPHRPTWLAATSSQLTDPFSLWVFAWPSVGLPLPPRPWQQTSSHSPLLPENLSWISKSRFCVQPLASHGTMSCACGTFCHCAVTMSGHRSPRKDVNACRTVLIYLPELTLAANLGPGFVSAKSQFWTEWMKVKEQGP